MKTHIESECSGCLACINACPAEAIHMVRNKKGFWYPEVSSDKCIHCDMCVKVCPMTKSLKNIDAVPQIYAARNADSGVLRNSSSGGIFRPLSDYIISQNGIVYGVVYDEQFHVRHSRAETSEDLERFYTSKYVQSDPEIMFTKLSEDLKNGKVVLISGTPCQISGIRAYLNSQGVSEDGLYCVDNLCHGVPSPLLWDDYLNILNRKMTGGDHIVSINMRSKHVPWTEQRIRISTTKGFIDSITDDFSFVKLYLSSMAVRDCCFSCPFTSFKRDSDITLADFWNSDSVRIPFSTKDGISEVIISTEKGRYLFDQIKNQLQIYPVTKQQAWQPGLEFSPGKPKKQEKFWEDYLTSSDREKVMRKYMKGSFLTQTIHAVSPFLRKTGLYSVSGKLYKKVFVKNEKGS